MTSSSGPLLKVDRARKQFGGVVAVNDVSFEVNAAEVVALIGPNGAGKSTTFNLITGILTTTGGQIEVHGQPVDNTPPQEVVKLGIARTFQHVKLVPDMTVLENVAIGAHLRGRSGALGSMLRLDLTIGRKERIAASLPEHLAMIEAMEARNTELAEKLARDHTLRLAAYVETHGQELFA